MKRVYLTKYLSQLIQNTVEGTASGGSDSTLEDIMRTEGEGYFDNGTIWFFSGSYENLSAVIGSWDAESKTFSFSFELRPIGVQRDDVYAAAPADYPRWLLIQKINEALRDIMPTLETVIMSVANADEYVLPAGVCRVRNVEIGRNTSSPYEYVVHNHWKELTYLTETDLYGYKLRFYHRAPDEDNLPIRITYAPLNTDLQDDGAEIPDNVPLNLLLWKAAASCLRWRIERTREDEPERVRLLNEALANAVRMANTYEIPTTHADMRFSRW